MTDLLQRLNLIEEEEAVADFSNDEGEMEPPVVEWGARWEGSFSNGCPCEYDSCSDLTRMGQPYWSEDSGNRGENGDNMFVAEFGSSVDMERALSGTLWMVGRHAMILKVYDEKLSATEIIFGQMEI
jgi:hypothetical protein